ncbi:MAG: metal ABC transporter permease [Planctomycetota bacterium]
MYDPSPIAALLVAVCVGVACGALSPVVVARRWAFAAEGIAHSAFGGAGVAWILAIMLPAAGSALGVEIAVVAACLTTALAMALLSRRRGVSVDVAVGVVLSLALAVGFIGQGVYFSATRMQPVGFYALLVGRSDLAWIDALVAGAVTVGVVGVLVLIRRGVLAFAVDPELARSSGLPERAVHFLLMLLLAAVVALGVRLAGSLLVTALLVLPAATAGRLTRKLGPALWLSVLLAPAATLIGHLAAAQVDWLPPGPAVVITATLPFGVSLLKR